MTLAERPHQGRTETAVQTPTPAALVNEVATSDRVWTTSGSRVAPDAFIAAAVGVVLAVIGLIVSIRGGFAGPMSTPVVKVLGFTHATTLGLIAGTVSP